MSPSLKSSGDSTMRTLISSLFVATLIIVVAASCSQDSSPDWPSISNQHKPWTRWWWQGNALTKEGITTELEAYAKAGLGGVEITPIYGVHGYEEKFVQYLSDEWMDLFVHTLSEANRLGLGVDIATGTGWPFGGPWVSDVDACKNIFYKVYSLNEGQSLKEKVTFIQPPFLRAVGSQVYEVHDNAAAEGRPVAGTRKEPLQKFDPANIKVEQLKQPVSENENLQALALDQVQFERPLPLVALMAYKDDGEMISLTSSVDADGKLNWVAPGGKWKLYAIFQGWHGKMVERAGPGGEGNVIDHFSDEALSNYLSKFDSALLGRDLGTLRAFFNDSYEVDDARGAADWTPTIINEFATRRGYSLLDHLPALFGEGNPDESERILHDYRLTVGELLLENFTRPWAQWAHDKKKLVRNQAHGAPANILDLYAEVDIPETEGVEPLRIKMATSAGHVSGKKMISSESATWLDEHFLSGLGDIKANVDRYLVNGVNHVLYHGTSYSPPGEPWPGWLFYAAVHLNPRNPQWNDFAALNRYIARCQSFLQQGSPDNDVLLYYPIADRYSARGPEMVEHFDSPVNAFKGTAFMQAADTLLASGYTFDFISDNQLQQLNYNDGRLVTSGGANYKTVVVPKSKYIPIETIRKLRSLADNGASIIFYGGFPESPAGFANQEAKQKEFAAIIGTFDDDTQSDSDDLQAYLYVAGVTDEPIAKLHGLSYTRRILENGNRVYFVVNPSQKEFNGWFPVTAESATVRDPWSGLAGAAVVDKGVFLQIDPGQSLILELSAGKSTLEPYQFFAPGESVVALDSSWQLEFISGGPVLPAPMRLDTLTDWTKLSAPEFETFSGTAVYSTTFSKPVNGSSDWMLTLGDVHGTATVFINDDSIATLISSPFNILLDGSKLKTSNKLEVRISNLMANRIIDLEKRGVLWKKFYNVNFPARKPENRRNGIFYAADWSPLPSGLSGPVTIGPAKLLNGAN